MIRQLIAIVFDVLAVDGESLAFRLDSAPETTVSDLRPQHIPPSGVGPSGCCAGIEQFRRSPGKGYAIASLHERTEPVEDAMSPAEWKGANDASGTVMKKQGMLESLCPFLSFQGELTAGGRTSRLPDRSPRGRVTGGSTPSSSHRAGEVEGDRFAMMRSQAPVTAS